MKYITLLILTLMFSLQSFSQGQFPRYFTDSTGKKIGVIFSIKQAQKIDNDGELLKLMNKMDMGCDSVINEYKLIVADNNQVIATQTIKIGELTNLGLVDDSIIGNLKDQIVKYQAEISLDNQLVADKDKEIGIDRKQITKLKVQKVAGFTIMGVAGGGLVAILVYGIVKGFFVIK